MKKKNNGFTLIELMVAVGLMVLLLGIVFNIFTSASEVMTRTEATMEMFQNARVIFDIISQDLTNAREIKKFNNMTTLSDSQDILTLITTTSWIKTETENNTQTQTIGSAEVTYSLKKTKEFASKKLYYLQRQIKNEEEKPTVIGEYLVAPDATDDKRNIPFYIEAFTSDSSSHKWENKGSLDKDPQDNKKYLIPPAVRVTMTLADEFLRNRQTFSRIFWIPQGK